MIEWSLNDLAAGPQQLRILSGLPKALRIYDLVLAALEKIIFGDRNIVHLPQNLYKSNYT